MIEFYDLDEESQFIALSKARDFLVARSPWAHLYKYVIKGGVPPSGSDMFHPELWKDCHWAWFRKTGWGLLNAMGEDKHG